MLNEVKSAFGGNKIAFRMDDVGASTKQFEVYSKFPLGNILFLKYLPPFKAWGPYNELSEKDWKEIISLLDKTNSSMTVAITSAWVEKKGDLTPFPKKFPVQAKILKDASEKGIIEIANHGLTHCVVGKHLPKIFSSNRKFHREFFDYIPEKVIAVHLEESQKILEDYFEKKIVTFTPPGNMYTDFTWDYAQKLGIKYLSGQDEHTFTFHDKDIVLKGAEWLKRKIQQYKDLGYQIVTVKSL